MEKRKIRWGVIGSGYIVNLWLAGAMQTPDTEVVAIASRTKSNAEKMAKKFSIPFVCDEVDELLNRDDIDIVYIAVPHTQHKEMAMKAFACGKNVLCEKPLSINSKNTAAMFDEAKKKNLFLMEAMWMRFFPALIEVQRIIKSGEMGVLKSITATFGFNTDVKPSHRLLNLNLAGGAVLDVGGYCLHFCDALTDSSPVDFHGFTVINGDENNYGVDEQDFVIARYPNNVLADLRFAVKNDLGQAAELSFSEGSISFERFWSPTSFTVTKSGESQTYNFEVPNPNKNFIDTGFQYEISHVNDCLRKGAIESDIMSWDKTNRTMKVCDQLRADWNLKYPEE
jgi:predicted dehydrogenase